MARTARSNQSGARIPSLTSVTVSPRMTGPFPRSAHMTEVKGGPREEHASTGQETSCTCSGYASWAREYTATNDPARHTANSPLLGSRRVGVFAGLTRRLQRCSARFQTLFANLTIAYHYNPEGRAPRVNSGNALKRPQGITGRTYSTQQSPLRRPWLQYPSPHHTATGLGHHRSGHQIPATALSFPAP